MTTWSRTPPTTAAMLDDGMAPMETRLFWVRGWDYNRPMLMSVTMGLRRRTPDAPLAPELHYHVLREWPSVPSEPAWEADFLPALAREADPDSPAMQGIFGRNWRPLEWGPEVAIPHYEEPVTWPVS